MVDLLRLAVIVATSVPPAHTPRQPQSSQIRRRDATRPEDRDSAVLALDAADHDEKPIPAAAITD
jgi:hypothetical protein